MPVHGLLGFQCILFGYIYKINLELEDNFRILYDLIYLYIYDVYRSWASCNWATLPAEILVNMYTLVYFASKVITLMIKSHDEYQSIVLVGLTHAERPSSENWFILGHYRSYWREWRTLVTPSSFCIKEGVEPWKAQRWSFTSHVQVRVTLLSLPLSLSSPPVLLCSIVTIIIKLTNRGSF